jgi:hypothetical protein
MPLLLIYDGDDPDVASGAARRTDRERIVRLGITDNGSNLLSSLDALLTSRQTFHRIVFDTHGAPGSISFGNAGVDAAWVRSQMAGRGYEAICPGSTRIYFNGCNVAEGQVGSGFLRAIASIFLLRGGGSVFGHTSLGFTTRWGLYPRTVHLWGDVRTIYVVPGGRVIEEFVQ